MSPVIVEEETHCAAVDPTPILTTMMRLASRVQAASLGVHKSEFKACGTGADITIIGRDLFTTIATANRSDKVPKTYTNVQT